MTFPALLPYGWNDRWAALLADESETSGTPVLPGRVVRHDGVAITVALPDGIRQVVLSRKLDPHPAVGDWVAVDGDVPVTVLPRTSLLTRRSVRTRGPQQLAANVDAVLVVCGLDRPVARAASTALPPWPGTPAPCPPWCSPRPTSRTTPPGRRRGGRAPTPASTWSPRRSSPATALDACRALVAGRTVVLVGESGAGKSSLTNACWATTSWPSGEVAGRRRQGPPHDHHPRGAPPPRRRRPDRHAGPALRRACGPTREAVAATFADIDELAEGCRFNDCNHQGEPGCAVRGGPQDGTLAAERFAGWQELGREAESAELRAAPTCCGPGTASSRGSPRTPSGARAASPDGASRAG